MNGLSRDNRFARRGVTERSTAVSIKGKIVRDINPDEYEKDENMFGTSGGFGRGIEKKLKEGKYWNK